MIQTQISPSELISGSGIEQGKQLLQVTANIMYDLGRVCHSRQLMTLITRRLNVHIFQMVYTIHNIITTIPNQVERQQPVYFLDAMEKRAPFFLDFIRFKEVR